MKIKNVLLILVLIFASSNFLAQDVKIKKGLVTVDGQEYVKVEKSQGNMSVYDLSGENELIFIKLYDPTPTNNKNSDSYYIVRFLGFDQEVEFDNKTRKGIIKLIYKSKLIKDGVVDEDKMKTFVTKYGTDSTRRLY